MAIFSFIQTVTTAAAALKIDIPLNRVRQLDIGVRSMGTSTYIRVGGLRSQDRSLLSVDDDLPISPSGDSEYLDVSTLRVISDTSDAVIEVIGETYEGNLPT